MGEGAMRASIALLMLTGRAVNSFISLVVFSVLDIVDVILCIMYKAVDFVMEAEWKPCYCSSPKEAIMSSGKIFVSEQGKSKIVRLCSRKLQLEDVSETLYRRPSLVWEMVRSTVMGSCKKVRKGRVGSTVTINSTIVEMLQGKRGGQRSDPAHRWSDCDCESCTCWTSSSCKERLFVRTQGPEGGNCVYTLFIKLTQENHNLIINLFFSNVYSKYISCLGLCLRVISGPINLATSPLIYKKKKKNCREQYSTKQRITQIVIL